MVALYAIPDGAASAKEWVLWLSELIGGLIVIGVAVRKSAKFFVQQTREGLIEMLRPELDKINANADKINTKVEKLSRRNDIQHAEVAKSIEELRSHFDAHMADAEQGRDQLRQLIEGHPPDGGGRVKFPY